MRKNISILLVLLTFGLSYGQNKYSKYLASKKLAQTYKTVKESDKDEYFQQYFWVAKAEQLATFPHLKSIKPITLYQMVKEINPATATKKLSADEKRLRESAEIALNAFILRKDLDNPNFMFNLESYVDPSGNLYYTEVNPERVVELTPKTLYTFTSINKKSRKEKIYYVWINDNKGYRIVGAIPDDGDEKFYKSLRAVLPNYRFVSFVPEIKTVKGGPKKDEEFFYIKPFEQDTDQIEYRTKDFKTFELTRYKKVGEDWKSVLKEDK